MTAADSCKQAARVLPPHLREEALSLTERDKSWAEEFRLRVGWPMTGAG